MVVLCKVVSRLCLGFDSVFGVVWRIGWVCDFDVFVGCLFGFFVAGLCICGLLVLVVVFRLVRFGVISLLVNYVVGAGCGFSVVPSLGARLDCMFPACL